MNKLFVRVFVTATLLAAGINTTMAQGAVSVAAPVAAEAGGAYVGKKLVGTCLRHPILCAATVAVGARYVHKEVKSIQKLDAETPACNDGYVSLYRAVGSLEHPELTAIQRYVLVPGGMEKKEFFLDVANSQWLAAFNQRYETSATKAIFIVTSRVCAATVALGENFSDANRQAIAFDAAALKFVNLDASRTGGIQTVWSTGAMK